MHLVHDSAEAEPIARRTTASKAAALCAAALAAAVLSACGDDDAGEAPVDLGGPTIDARVELANCENWNESSVEERLGTIAQIENFVSGPVGNDQLRGNALPQDKAYDVLDSYCGEEFAQGFRLYKLYTRAAAFTPPEQAP